MLTVKFDEKSYVLPLQDALNSLTGDESALIERYLEGWANFRSPSHVTRSLVVMIWLAKRHAGETTTLEEIASTPGLLFGDKVDLEGDPDDPEDPMQDPGRPLADRNGTSGADAGTSVSSPIRETSVISGTPPSLVSTE